MELIEAIRTRKSVRSWDARVPSNEVLYRIFDHARLAPSAKNLQDWHIVVSRDARIRRALGDAADQPFVAQAPVVLSICGDRNGGTMHCGVPRWIVDASILIDHITLCCVNEGLGSCWIGHFDQTRVAEVLEIPDHWEVIELLPVGYPADRSLKSKKRKSLGETVSWEKWGGAPPGDFS